MSKKLKCKGCPERFERDSMIKVQLNWYHSFECASAHGLAKARKKANADTVKRAKAVRAAQKAAKEKVKPKSKWLSELQSEFNRYVRLVAVNDGCISCDKPASWDGQWHCSHYYSRGHSPALRFHLWNCHKSCSVCNSHLSGNIGEYTPRLIEKIGADRYDWLVEHKSDAARYDIDYIKRAIKIARKKIKRELKKPQHELT